MFAAVGVPVRRLVRVRFGTLRIDATWRLGDVRELSAAEKRQLDALSGARWARSPANGCAGHRTRGLVVSIDGPGGSGKSTVGMRAAARLGYRFCDTGVLYRGLTWLAMERGADLDDAATSRRRSSRRSSLRRTSDDRYVHLLVDGARGDRAAAHGRGRSRGQPRVAARTRCAPRCSRSSARSPRAGRIIMAGRDIGTVVLPDADLKLYLDVSVEERARRRAAERGLADDARAVEQIADELRRRDGIDSTRETAPLRIPDGATVVTTDGNTLEQTVAAGRRDRPSRARRRDDRR